MAGHLEEGPSRQTLLVRSLALLAFAQLVLVTGTVGTKMVFSGINPVLFFLLRSLLGLPLLAAISAATSGRTRSETPRDTPLLLLAGAGQGLFKLGNMIGLSLLGPVFQTVWMGSGPAVTLVLALALGRETASTRKVAGVGIVGLSCVALVLGSVEDDEGANAEVGVGRVLIGHGALLLGNVAMGASTLSSKEILRRQPGVSGVWLQTLIILVEIAVLLGFGALYADGPGALQAALCPPADGCRTTAAVSTAAAATLAGVALLNNGGNALVTAAGRHADASFVGSSWALQPLIAAALDSALIGATPAPHAGLTPPSLAALCSMGGIALGLGLVVSASLRAKPDPATTTAAPPADEEAGERDDDDGGGDGDGDDDDDVASKGAADEERAARLHKLLLAAEAAEAGGTVPLERSPSCSSLVSSDAPPSRMPLDSLFKPLLEKDDDDARANTPPEVDGLGKTPLR